MIKCIKGKILKDEYNGAIDVEVFNVNVEDLQYDKVAEEKQDYILE